MPAGCESDYGLNKGKIIAKRWKIVKKLGEGACGYVFQVEEISTKALAALKVELADADTGHVLKLEVQILKRLKGRRHIPQLFHCGKRHRYSYMVMTLLGPSLDQLTHPHASSVSTQIRVGIHILFGLKQLHEVGFVHRDVKPSNLAVGYGGTSDRVFHLLDFGLSREFVIRSKGSIRIRNPRPDALFRGTSHYCSISALEANEQCRADDLWAMLYVLAEMRDILPWDRLRTKSEIRKSKADTLDEELFYHSPAQLINIAAHLRTLDYYARPDYLLIFEQFYDVMSRLRISHSDPFDWESRKEYDFVSGLSTTVKPSSHAPLLRPPAPTPKRSVVGQSFHYETTTARQVTTKTSCYYSQSKQTSIPPESAKGGRLSEMYGEMLSSTTTSPEQKLSGVSSPLSSEGTRSDEKEKSSQISMPLPNAVPDSEEPIDLYSPTSFVSNEIGF